MALAGGALLAWGASAAPASAQDLRTRVVDVCNGLCVVVRAPGGHTMLYDAGDRGGWCLKAVEERVPAGDVLDLVVISHSDADHIGELPQILQARRAGTVDYAGDAHLDETQAIRNQLTALRTAGTRVWRLADAALPDPDDDGARAFSLGDARVTLVAGWSDGDMTIGPGETRLPKAEHNNALSIVARVEYRGRSVLLTGDTVGRLRRDPPTACAYAERIMVGRVAGWPLASDVLIGQHHGGDNSTSNCFIRAVDPRFVVFSAGSKGHKRPTQAVADRLTSYGVRAADMFRTDRGDDEGPGGVADGEHQGLRRPAGRRRRRDPAARRWCRAKGRLPAAGGDLSRQEGELLRRPPASGAVPALIARRVTGGLAADRPGAVAIDVGCDGEPHSPRTLRKADVRRDG